VFVAHTVVLDHRPRVVRMAGLTLVARAGRIDSRINRIQSM